MSHKILVMSPLHQNGATVVSTIIAQTITYTNKTSTLTFTQHASLLPTYLGLSYEPDPTMSIMQVCKLIDSNVINDAEILDYTKIFAKNAHLMDVSDPTLSERDSANVVNHVFNRVATDIVVCDNSDDLTSESSERLIDTADQIVIVIQPTLKNIIHLKSWMDTELLSKNKRVFVVVNYYNEAINSVRNIAKELGMSANTVCKLHYNPYIAKCCNTGKLADIVPFVKAKDPRVLNITADLKEIEQCITSGIVARRGGKL